MKRDIYFSLVLIVLLFFGCASLPVNKITSEKFLGYQPVDPIPVSKVKIFDSEINGVTEVFWKSLNSKSKRSLLPLQSAQSSVSKNEVSGKISYLGASISAEEGSYQVIMDYMKYRVEDVFDVSGNYIGSGRIGVGLRIKAVIVTKKSNLNLGSLSAIGLQADQENLSGGISVDVVGIDSENVTNLIPLTSEIDQTSIQTALQSLASIKSKLWEEETTITPHLIAFRQAQPNKEAEIRSQISTFIKTVSGDILRKYWKPDGENIDKENEKNIKRWMENNRISTGRGSITIFFRASEYEDLRKKAIRELNLVK